MVSRRLTQSARGRTNGGPSNIYHLKHNETSIDLHFISFHLGDGRFRGDEK